MRSTGKRLLPCLLAAACLLLPGTALADEPAPTISVSPDHFAFGPINVGGELGEPGEFTVTNTGSGTAHLDSAGITGTDHLSFALLANASSCYFLEPAGELAPGASCTLVTIFDPVDEGPHGASLELISDAASSPDVMPLTGTGFPRLLPGATLDPQAADFGSQQSGTASSSRTFTLTSSGSGDLDIGIVTLSGADTDQFRLTSNNCSNRVMASGDSCQIQVVFLPEGTGSRSASFTVTTDADGDDTTVDLTGTATTTETIRRSRVLTEGRLPRVGRSGKQVVPVRCQTSNMDRCRGRLTLRVRGRALGLRHKRLVTIGSRPYSLSDGNHELGVRLGSRARQSLHRHGNLRVRVISTSRQGDGSARVSDVVRYLRRSRPAA
ncbi:MAG: choice-of-anchor D domain-containing protein [Solirubrobacterales bacterium]|nr:choice-of-anchor D domain-containing protein [Solirubrobacterales bacterium]HRV60010.1 choice-of-anchor D domain-containing protein [Solirubrobacterales bacterium]